MRKVVAYQVIEGTLSDIKEEVKALIEEKSGWEPHGDLIRHADDQGRIWYIREMIKVKYPVKGMQDFSNGRP